MGEVMDVVRGYAARSEVQALLIVLGSIVGAVILDLVLRRIVGRLAAHTKTDLDDRLIRLLQRPVYSSAVLIGIYLAVRRLDFAADVERIATGSIVTVAVLIWTFSGRKIISTLLEGLGEFASRVHWLDSRTLPLFDNLARLVLFGAALYCILLAWHLNVAPWLASAGILGIAVGFAAKDTLANLFGGLFVIIDAPYKVGDYIHLDSGERGQVTQIGLRSTRLLTRDDVEITVPNGVIANAKIVNESGGPSTMLRLAIDVGVAYGSDVDRVREILIRAAKSVERVAEDPEPRIRFTSMGDSALIFRVLCWIEEPAQRGLGIDSLNTAVYKALNAEGIQIPFPQRDVHLRYPQTDERA